MKRQMAALVLAVALGHAAHAQSAHPISPRPDLDKLGDQFLGTLKAGKSQEAFAEAFKDLPAMSSQAATMGATTGSLLSSFGGIEDWSPVAEQSINQTFVRRTYYVRTGALPLFATIIFYNPGKSWRMVDVQLGTYYNEQAKGHLIEP